MSSSDRPSPTLDGAHLSRAALLLLTFGTIGGLLFHAVYMVEGIVRPHYNAFAEAVSLLSLGPGGWIQQANFILFGLVTLFCLGLGWRIALRAGPGATAYPVLKVIEGAAIVVVGLFSQDPAGGYPPGASVSTTLHGDIHNAASGVIVTALALSSFVLARRLAGEPSWGRAYAAMAVATGLLTIVFISIFGAMSAHRGLAGVFERLAFIVNSVFYVAVVGRLLLQYRGSSAKRS